jgi:hypothetical protein
MAGLMSNQRHLLHINPGSGKFQRPKGKWKGKIRFTLPRRFASATGAQHFESDRAGMSTYRGRTVELDSYAHDQ